MDPEEHPEHVPEPLNRAQEPQDCAPSEAETRVPKYCPVRSGVTYSLRDAAVLLGIPEGTLRRAILLEEVPAEEVSDDRQYLIEGQTLLAFVRSLRPGEEIRQERDEGVWWSLALLALIPLLAALLLLAVGAASARLPDGPSLPSPGSGVEITLPDR